MRAYFFGNMYLSSIQQGIQAGHVIAELFQKYPVGPGSTKGPHYNILMAWARDHKTMVLLNAGYSSELWLLRDSFSQQDNPYPWAFFHESEEALDKAFTSIGIVVPERIYETAKYCRESTVPPDVFQNGTVGDAHGMPTDLSDWECELINRLNTYSLAR